MPTKDFRVRLSAEGQQEVVNAFRRVQQEAGKTKQSAVDASSGFNQLKDAAHSLAIEFLGYTAAVEALSIIKSAVSNSIEFAAGMEKLQEKTGISAATLQVFSAAAKRVNVDQEVVAKGLTLFAKAMGNAELGSSKASAAIKGLFGNVDALKGLTTEEKLLKITAALAKMEAGGKKTAIAAALFGRSGMELIPVIDQLNSQGFEKMRKKLEDLGVLLSDDMVASARQAEASLGDLKMASQGIATQFTAGFLPALADVAEGIASAAGGGASAFKELGSTAGQWMKFAILWVGSLAIQLREVGDKAIAVAKGLVQLSPENLVMAIAGKGVKKTFADIWVGAKEDWQTATRNADAEIQVLGEMVADKVKDVTKRIGKGAPDTTESEMTARAKAALAKAHLDFEKSQASEKLQLSLETNRLAVENEKARWKLGAESVSAYYQHRIELEKAAAKATKDGIEAEIAAEEKLLRTTSDPAKRVEIQKTISELKTKAALAELKATEIQNKLVTEQADEYKKLAEEVLHFQDKIAEAQGKGHAAEIAAIDREAEKYRTELLQLGSSNVEAKVAEFTKVMTAQADFKQAQKEAEESLRHLQEARKRIEDQAATGAISEAEKRRELIKLDREQLPALQALYEVMQKIAQQSGVPALVKDTEEFALKVDEADAALRKVKSSSVDVGKELNKSLGHDLNKFFTKGIYEAKNFGDAMRGLAMSITASMAQMFQQLMLKMIQAKIQAKLLGGDDNKDGGGGGGGLMGFLSGMMSGGKAGGGEIHGPGTGTSDSVPIWASTGEYVVRAAAVKQPGIRELLQTINSGLLTPRLARSRGPNFAQGGEVAAGGFVLGGGRSGSAALTVGLDHGLLIKSLEAHPNFGRVVVKHLSENRKAANTALGK